MNQNQKIILASSSPYRKDLLSRLNLSFDTVVPDIDESVKKDESASQLVLRLSCEKAVKVGEQQENALVIGSDQVACLNGRILTKPGCRKNALEQLQQTSGEIITFLTGLCLFNSATKVSQLAVIPFDVIFREYDIEEIQRYLDIDAPYDCAGSFKSENMGITLVKKMVGDDPTALMGLPLITLSGMLRNQGVKLP